MPTRKLPASPSLAHLKNQARDLMASRPTGDRPTLQRIREFHPRFADANDCEIAESAFSLTDAQFTIAREYGFASWPRLKSFVQTSAFGELDRPLEERITDPVFREALRRLDAGDVEGLRQWIAKHPGVVRRRVEIEGGNYFRNPSLLEFAAENPIRNGTLPPNIVEVMKLILAAGGGDVSETLGLVCSGQVSRECGVQGAMIDLLCAHGADPNAAMRPALGHGEFEAVESLLRNGATLTFAAATATGRTDDALRLLPGSDAVQRHDALAYGAQYGREPIVRRLLEEGEDPNRFNPVGVHAHSTPLHQAALAGHRMTVQTLLAFGARADIQDVLWGGTALDWAEHGGQSEIVDLITSHIEAKGHE